MFKISLEALRKGLGFEEKEERGEQEGRDEQGKAAGKDMEIGGELGPYGRETREAQAVPAFMAGTGEGVSVQPVPVTSGQQLSIRYSGLLATSGAQQVILHYGYGPGEWRKVTDVPMRKDPDGTWVAGFKVEDGGRLAFCFRDNAFRWDNNNGRNWSYEIHSGDLYH